ncbi:MULTISPECIES: GntR family transcriptional regulator [Kandleria]|jgi:GntR family transcriptional regulator|uniref:GntR family transcriptional regulator n=1 Tax=Kandleria vitulina TaxID=1630 RepID=A0A1H2VXD4_9FIRM|nr:MULTISPECIES: GntR family transcriptional regulator [Kandleria]MBP3276383.1 GntR family transcriptional regulator [Kandleria sp.]MEE0988782.1 GntR family transcriptional regulator [Kandleria vitulina]SDW73028.1 GntR family transcriptional regulator [Kandleria vitulina]HAD23407.1 GntR family transcriptional regulator [Kandleria vitulina]HAH74890.1 GntR family transcriptional regulator [Kandleria vitulina]
MNIIINTQGMVPIYEQIVDQIKKSIYNEELKEKDKLPSVRSLSNTLRISALTVKKAYDALEQEGLIITVHGKGSYIAPVDRNVVHEQQVKDIEKELSGIMKKARRSGLSNEDVLDIMKMIMEES